ncbi:MAG: porin family protein [Bacteroidaceae bacterium]|nr:porin family protein [Bacteroidaceae bacterium]
MKKFISALFVAVCCMAMAIPAQAQVKFGVKGGLNLSKMDWEIANTTLNNVKENSTGFFIGPMVEATVPLIGIGVDGALMYSQRGSGELKQQGIEVPINLKYTIGLGDMAAIFFAAGPDFYFNLKDVDIAAIKKKDAQVGLNLGGGVKLLNHLQIGVNYQFALGNSFDLKGLTNVNVKNKLNTWQISLAYMF